MKVRVTNNLDKLIHHFGRLGEGRGGHLPGYIVGRVIDVEEDTTTSFIITSIFGDEGGRAQGWLSPDLFTPVEIAPHGDRGNPTRDKAIDLIVFALHEKTDEELSRLYSLEVNSVDTILVGESEVAFYQGEVRPWIN